MDIDNMTDEELDLMFDEMIKEEQEYKEWLKNFSIGTLTKRYNYGMDNICNISEHS